MAEWLDAWGRFEKALRERIGDDVLADDVLALVRKYEENHAVEEDDS